MEKLQVHNNRLDVWFVVDNGKVYDAKTMIQLSNDSREAVGALSFIKNVWMKYGIKWAKLTQSGAICIFITSMSDSFCD